MKQELFSYSDAIRFDTDNRWGGATTKQSRNLALAAGLLRFARNDALLLVSALQSFNKSPVRLINRTPRRS